MSYWDQRFPSWSCSACATYSQSSSTNEWGSELVTSCSPWSLWTIFSSMQCILWSCSLKQSLKCSCLHFKNSFKSIREEGRETYWKSSLHDLLLTVIHSCWLTGMPSTTIERTLEVLYSVVSIGTCPLPLHCSWATTDHNTLIDQVSPTVCSSIWVENSMTLEYQKLARSYGWNYDIIWLSPGVMSGNSRRLWL